MFAAILPIPLKRSLRNARTWLRALPFHGNQRYCPVCGKTSSRFKPFGEPSRADAQCAHCYSLERHRFTWLFFERQTELFSGRPKSLLHFAPEIGFEPRLRKRIGPGYITADLSNPEAMQKIDITSIQHPDASFDVVYCSHVLEHVPDDAQAMRELRRVLKPDGWAVLLVPQRAGPTYEDPAIVEPEARRAAFGQSDHVRWYGDDFINRLEDAGFRVRCIKTQEIASPAERERMALTAATGDIFYCTPRSL